jgi:hypothetical protein
LLDTESDGTITIFVQMVGKFTINGPESLSSGIFMWIEEVVSHRKADKLTCLWVLLKLFSCYIEGQQELPVSADCLARINDCLVIICDSLGIPYSRIMGWDSWRNLCSQISDFVVQLSSKMLHRFIELCQTLFPLNRQTSVCFMIMVTLVFANVLTSVRVQDSETAKLIRKEITHCFDICRDPASPIIASAFGLMCDSVILRGFEASDLEKLQKLACRAVYIKSSSKDMQTETAIFLAKVLMVAPADVIRQDKTRVIEALTQCLEYENFEIILDSVEAVILCDNDIHHFLNMSSISLPRIVTLSVSEKKEVRLKAIAILEMIAKRSEGETLLSALVRVLGVQQVYGLAEVVCEWATNHPVSEMVIQLLKELAEVLKEDKKLKQGFAKKVCPILLPILRDDQNKLQLIVLELVSDLLS